MGIDVSFDEFALFVLLEQDIIRQITERSVSIFFILVSLVAAKCITQTYKQVLIAVNIC